MRKSVLALTTALTLLPMLVFAHGNTKPQHGGIVQMSGETVFELVVKPASVELYVTEDDEPVSPADAAASLVVTKAGKENRIVLAAGEGNGFAAKTAVPEGASVGVVVEYKNGTKTFTTYTLK